MAAPIRIKRRAGGNPGAPTSLLNAELAFNEVDDTLYYGKGSGGAGGTATTVIAIGGPGFFVNLTGDQIISGAKTFSGDNVFTKPVTVATPTANGHAATKKWVEDTIAGFGAGDMATSVYDPTKSGKVLAAAHADSADNATLATNATNAANVPWSGVANKPTAFPPSNHTHAMTDITGLTDALSLKAPLESPSFTGSPTGPTAPISNNSTQLATTAFVMAQIQQLVGTSPEVLDTLQEIAEALGNDPNFAGTMTTELAKKAEKEANLSDLADIPEARTNLGLKSMALQDAGAVAITGGTINGVTLDGGVF